MKASCSEEPAIPCPHSHCHCHLHHHHHHHHRRRRLHHHHNRDYHRYYHLHHHHHHRPLVVLSDHRRCQHHHFYCPFHANPGLTSLPEQSSAIEWHAGTDARDAAKDSRVYPEDVGREEAEQAPEEDNDDEPVFVLTDEWKEFFAKSEAKRKLKRKQANKEKN